MGEIPLPGALATSDSAGYMSTIQPLFKRSVLDRAVQKFLRSKTDISDQHSTVLNWIEAIEERHLDKYTETQVEQAFNRAIWTESLDYVPIGSSDKFHIHPKATRSGTRDTPDFALGLFETRSRKERWRVVGEIKDIHTSLDRPQLSRYSKETPVQQGFRYAMRGPPGIEWVVVTNFQEVRLYRAGYQESYQCWQLPDLRDEERFAEFYYVLCREHLCPAEGISTTYKLLEDSLSAGRSLTRGFYGLYEEARHEILVALRRRRDLAHLDDNELIAKVHKLLNRVLFIKFCEDHPAQLLARNTLQALHDLAAKEPSGPCHVFDTVFQELDAGSPPASFWAFNAFNGGLFARDPDLDPIDIPKKLFTKTIRGPKTKGFNASLKGVFGFQEFDFSTDLDVDSMGAIFEQSLKDIPHLIKGLRGKGEQSVSKRKSTGVYYTPKELTVYLVDRALEEFLRPIRERLQEQARKAPLKKQKRALKKGTRLSTEERRQLIFLDSMLTQLRSLRVLDPACGSGNFLISAFERLHREYTEVQSAIADIASAAPLYGLNKVILRDNILGFDILPESVEITRLSLWLRTAEANEPLAKLDDTIQVCDTLRRPPEECADLVVSNPPWGSELPGWDREALDQTFPGAGRERDSYALFTIQGLRLLRPGGILAYVLPNSWITVEGYAEFRKTLLETCDIIEVTHVWKIFSDVNLDSCLLIARKKEPGLDEAQEVLINQVARGESEEAKAEQLARCEWQTSFPAKVDDWKGNRACKFDTIFAPTVSKRLRALSRRCTPLGDQAEVTVGIQVYHHTRLSKSDIKREVFHSDRKEGSDWHPFVKGAVAQRFFLASECVGYLKYSEDLHDKRELDHYSERKILVQQILSGGLSAVMQPKSRSPLLYLNSIFGITETNDGAPLATLLAVLNCRFISASYDHWCNRLLGDIFPKVSKADLASLPVPNNIDRYQGDCERLVATLSNGWSKLKSAHSKLRENLALLDLTKKQVRRLLSPRGLDPSSVRDVLSDASGRLSRAEVASVKTSGKAYVRSFNQWWPKVQDAELEIEELLRDSYGIPAKQYREVLERHDAPDPSILLRPPEHLLSPPRPKWLYPAG